MTKKVVCRKRGINAVCVGLKKSIPGKCVLPAMARELIKRRT